MYYIIVSTILVIIVTGGQDDSSVEVLSSFGVPHPCFMPELPAPRVGHTQDGLLSCGGGQQDTDITATSCVTLSSTGVWHQSHNLTEARVNHSSWMSPDGLVLIGGAFR